jgi:hypothetical protein
MAQITKLELLRLSEEKLTDAELLLGAGRHSNAYYLAGYAAELLLKAIISKRFSAETLPDRRLVQAVHTHNLKELAAHAGIDVALAQERRASPAFAAYWQIVTDWTEETRYASWSLDQSASLVTALNDPQSGVLKWLRQFL